VVDSDRTRWRAKPLVALFFQLAAYVLPFITAWLVVRFLADSLVRPEGLTGLVIWIVQAALLGTFTSLVVERLSRRLLPLALLFRLSLAFPDRAPSRFGLALRSGTIARRSTRISEIRRQGLGSDPVEAAAVAIELVTLLGLHDRRTRGHSERVRAYAEVIADELGLSSDDRDLLAWGALLHDVGKMSVPSEILNKRGVLEPVEWEILRDHPVAAEALLAPLRTWLGPAIGAITEHHEHWDGSGYPAGLVGSETSLAGRILAVADAYDVISSARSYKRPVSAEAARKELVAASGSHFDPAIVRPFLDVGLGPR
jgi:putative nucleotidyltransferase with HDIG domain